MWPGCLQECPAAHMLQLCPLCSFDDTHVQQWQRFWCALKVNAPGIEHLQRPKAELVIPLVGAAKSWPICGIQLSSWGHQRRSLPAHCSRDGCKMFGNL